MSDDNALLIARIDDALKLCSTKNAPRFVGFLNENERSAVQLHADAVRAHYAFYGGYEDAQRVVFAALPDWASAADVSFPIAAIQLDYRREYSLSHSDFLGRLMSLGIAREKIGDIVISEGSAVIFVISELAEYLLTQLVKVGSVGISAKISEGEIHHTAAFEDIRATVASERIDCVAAALCRTSREKAAAMVEQRLIFINSVECSSTSKRLKSGDTVSIRRYGKYIIDSLSDTTKKGRLVLIARKKI